MEAVDLFRVAYPELMNVQQNIELIQQSGYQLVHRFSLGERGHWDTYYEYLE